MKTILYIVAHPNMSASKNNKPIVEAVKAVPGVRVHELYVQYPDFKIDVKKEQELLEKADLIVLQFPFYWYNVPALLKEWEDKVLLRGWAYGPDGKKLHGKSFMMSLTTGGLQEFYHAGARNNYTVDELLRPQQQTAFLCGMTYLPAFVFNGAYTEDAPQRLVEHIAKLKTFLEKFQ